MEAETSRIATVLWIQKTSDCPFKTLEDGLVTASLCILAAPLT